VTPRITGQHPVALGNAIEALTDRRAHMADVEFLAPSEVLRVSSAGVREAQGRRLRALQGETVDIPSRKNAGSERPMNSAGAVKAFPQRIVAVAQQKLGRPLTGREPAFTARAGFLALETIRDTVAAATPSELEEYLNAE
jgi:hypothetical protein